MSKTGNTKRYILKITAILLLIVLLLSAALLLIDYWEKRQGFFPTQETGSSGSVLQYEGKDYVLKDNIETVLIMGLDKFGDAVDNSAYTNDQQADFLLLLVLDNENKTCTALQINRDTMAEMSVLGVAGQKIDTVTKQIALSHTYGNGKEISCHNTAEAVSKLLLGTRVKHYISLTMDAVSAINDLAGGVEVTVNDDFTGIDDTLIKGETVTLLGEHALNFVRTRYGLEDSSNSTRMERQRQYLNALYSKVLQCVQQDDGFIVEASLKTADYIVSDRSVNQLQELFRKISEYQFETIRSLEGRSVVGEQFIEFYPDEASLTKTVIELFYSPKD